MRSKLNRPYQLCMHRLFGSSYRYGADIIGQHEAQLRVFIIYARSNSSCIAANIIPCTGHGNPSTGSRDGTSATALRSNKDKVFIFDDAFVSPRAVKEVYKQFTQLYTSTLYAHAHFPVRIARVLVVSKHIAISMVLMNTDLYEQMQVQGLCIILIFKPLQERW